MFKYKFPGKPRKLVQRTLVNAYSFPITSYDISTTTENICYGISVFEKSFGDDAERREFLGFNETELECSIIKSEDFLSEVEEKFLSRGVIYSPPDSVKKHLFVTHTVPECKYIENTKECSEIFQKPKYSANTFKQSGKERKKCRNWFISKKLSNRQHTKVMFRHNIKSLNKNSLLRFKHKPLASNYLTEKYCRKFNLPSRSIHSSRVIKPNKWFMDAEKNVKISASYDNKLVRNPGDTSRKNKVIIREARLNITTEPAIAGSFSAEKKVSFDKKKYRSGFIACGVCGAIRYYKNIVNSKIFGIYSCEPCRRFLSKMRIRSKNFLGDSLQCRAENGIGKCVIVTSSVENDATDDTFSKTTRCEACWLNLCLQRYILSNNLRKSLIRLIPENLKLVSLNFPLDMKSFQLESVSGDEEGNLFNAKLDKRLNTNYLLKAVRSSRRNLERHDANGSIKFKNALHKKINKTAKSNINNENIVEVSRKSNSLSRGPRIKHVCRSASSVLRTSLNTSNEDEIDDTMNSIDLENYKSGRKDSFERNDKHSQSSKTRQCGVVVPTVFSENVIECPSQNYQGARTLQDFSNESCDECESNEEKLISIDFWEAYDPDEIFKTGFPLISSEPMNVRALCFLCGSAGLQKLLFCVVCCEPYHWFCAEGPLAFRGENDLEKARVSWICRKCKVCNTCGKSSRVGNLTSCKRCKNSYHSQCLDNKSFNKRLFKSDRPWVCPSCLKCKSCNSNNVFTHVGNIPLCNQCFKLRQKGNYCPLCQGCYQDEDYNVQMMECGTCKCWVHAKCEGISYEKYQILSFLPDSIEFICRLCCSAPPAQWWLVVEDELKAGYYGILKSLCKSKRVGDLLKENPRKDNRCTCPKAFSDDSETGLVMKQNSQLNHVKRLLSLEDDAIETSDASKEESNLNLMDKCMFCQRNLRIRNEMSHRLLTVKVNVRNNTYQSVSVFHQELKNLLSDVGDSDLIDKYMEILEQFFPWFDPHRVEELELLEKSIETMSNEETAESCDDQHNSLQKGNYDALRNLVKANEYSYENFQVLDTRKCNFCKELGEARPFEGGRMIYCGRNEWVHSNCALWSSEVFEEIDGSLQNVHSAMSRGRQIRCSKCEKTGASVGCCFKNCSLTYHFKCAKEATCNFLQNKTIYCHHHELKQKDLQLLVDEKDFEIFRPVYIEMDRKKKKLESLMNVRLRIGSLHVENLGKIDPHLSDNSEHILPVSFRCTRLFWSTNEPWKLVQYQIRIKVSYSYERNENVEENYTVDHAQENKRVVREVIDELLGKVCKSKLKCDMKRKCVRVEKNMKNDFKKDRASKCLRDRNQFNDEAKAKERWKKTKRRMDFENTTSMANKIRENGFISAANLNQGAAEKILQVDGMVDIYNDDEPVTCNQCNRTYRTTLSYERHLDTCNSDFADFMISSCESDSMSSEEGSKLVSIENSMPKVNVLNHAGVNAAFATKYGDTITLENNDVNNIRERNPRAHSYSMITFEDTQLSNNGLQNTMAVLKQETMNGTAQTLAIPISEQLEFGIVDNSKIDCNTNYGQIITSAPAQTYSIQSVPQQPTYVIQQQPTFVTVDAPQPLQIQPMAETVNLQPLVIGTMMPQSNVIETAAPTAYIVNTPTPTELFAQNNVLIQNQPLIYGMEMVVSNTVMSSSHHQFLGSLTRNIGSSTMYSATTTQVFQTAKEVPQTEISPGFILVNSSMQTTQPESQKVNYMPPVTPQSQEMPQKYFYVQVSDEVKHTKNEKKVPLQVIVRPVTKHPLKKATKVIKVSSRPVKGPATIESETEPVTPPNLQIKTTDKTVLVKKAEPVSRNAENDELKIILPKIEARQHVETIDLVSPNSELDCLKGDRFKLIPPKPPPSSVTATIGLGSPVFETLISSTKGNEAEHIPISVKSPSPTSMTNACDFSIRIPKWKPQDTIVKSTPSVLECTKEAGISENDRIFDELLRQHKLALQNKVEKEKEISSKSSEKQPEPPAYAIEPLPAPPIPMLPDEKVKKAVCVPKISLAINKQKYKPRIVARHTVDKQQDEKVTPSKKTTKPVVKEKENLGTKQIVGSKTWKTASISYEVDAEDGFSYKTNNLVDLWSKIIESVQQSRSKNKLPLLPKNASLDAKSVYGLLGMENNASKYLLEQLPDAWKCIFYKPLFHKSSMHGKSSLAENVSGCARTEPFNSSYKYDMFGWLASRHRKPPKFIMMSDSDIVNGNRRMANLNLPMAMRFRYLKETTKETVGVFRSDIHGRGLFCLRDIDAGEMVIEYAGVVIRSSLTDTREKYYTSKGIGCYMFRIDDKYVVDATMCGNAARFINHSCDPNCYSRIVDILGKKHIIIFALRRIPKGEELTYDYKFPLEDEKIYCHCLAKKCRKYLN